MLYVATNSVTVLYTMNNPSFPSGLVVREEHANVRENPVPRENVTRSLVMFLFDCPYAEGGTGRSLLY